MNTLPSHAVRARQFFFGPKEKVTIVFVGTHTECKEFIRADDALIYRPSNNESGRWTLRIVTTNSLTRSALDQAGSKVQEQSWRG